MRILIADEKALFRDALGTLVESHGCEVVAECEGGPEVIELAQRLAPDIILLSLGDSFSDVAQMTGYLAEHLPASAVIILFLVGYVAGFRP